MNGLYQQIPKSHVDKGGMFQGIVMKADSRRFSCLPLVGKKQLCFSLKILCSLYEKCRQSDIQLRGLIFSGGKAYTIDHGIFTVRLTVLCKFITVKRTRLFSMFVKSVQLWSFQGDVVAIIKEPIN